MAFSAVDLEIVIDEVGPRPALTSGVRDLGDSPGTT